MFGIVVIIAAVSIMAKAAEMEERSSFLWGFITLVICVLCGLFIPLFLINIVIGLVISYLLMFAAKLLARQE